MKNSDSSKSVRNLRSAYLFPAIISVSALTATFLVSNSNLEFEIKAAVFGLILTVYIIFSVIFYQRQHRQISSPIIEDIFNEDIEEKLLALEDAGKYFGASLKPDDMFRLVSGRINEIVPFSTCVLYVPDESETRFDAVQSFGLDAEMFHDVRFGKNAGLTGKTFSEDKVKTDETLELETTAINSRVLQNLHSGISVPLKNEGKIYGVLTLYSDRRNAFKPRQVKLLEAVGSRVSPLFLGSFTFEKNLHNALTDRTTLLPNERAFYLILENQIAESQRSREGRPLTILSIDIKNFDDLNKRFGHTIGDRILIFAAQQIKSQLRGMDFLARSSGDQFLAVLPTANDEITDVIIERIENAFAKNAFDTEDGRKEFISLSFGTASFLKDGETAQQLLTTATMSKQRAKMPHTRNILWFPSEYAS